MDQKLSTIDKAGRRLSQTDPTVGDSIKTGSVRAPVSRFTSVNNFIGSVLVEKSYAPLDNKETERGEKESV